MRRKTPPPSLDSWLDAVTFERVLVFTIDGDTVRGVVTEVFCDGIQLQDAQMLRANDNAVPFAGEVFISQSKIKFVQKPGADQ